MKVPLVLMSALSSAATAAAAAPALSTFHLPPLSSSCYKGSSGRLLHVSGSPAFVGASAFASVASLRSGIDLSSVYTPSDEAASSLRAITRGEVMVRSPSCFASSPGDSSSSSSAVLLAISSVSSDVDRGAYHAVVIGPGLGRSSEALRSAAALAAAARRRGVPVVVDADGLFPTAEEEDDVVKVLLGYKGAVLTPNKVELERLAARYCGSGAGGKEGGEDTLGELQKVLGVGAIVLKGRSDRIATTTPEGAPGFFECSAKGSPARCGGQGDVLAGVLGTFLAWEAMRGGGKKEGSFEAATYYACAVTREAARRAFAKEGRGISAWGLVDEIGAACEATFGDRWRAEEDA